MLSEQFFFIFLDFQFLGHKEIVVSLIENGAYINSITDVGDSALLLAADKGIFVTIIQMVHKQISSVLIQVT